MIFLATPLPTPPADFDLNSVTPTWVGFAATALVVIATIFLIFDMVRRIRRMRYRAEIGERLAEEVVEKENAKGKGPAGKDAASKRAKGNGSASKKPSS